MKNRYYKRDGTLNTDSDADIAGYREDRCVSRDDLGDGCYVSTVLLPLNHAFSDDEPPLIFETMIFGGKYEYDCWRYTTEEAAEIGHAKVVTALMCGKNPDSLDIASI